MCFLVSGHQLVAISELVRPKNSTEDDTILRSVEGMISSEQKNYSDRLSNKVFKECCDRIPTESWVHLLMTNESLMQGGYTAPRNRNIVVLRADVQGNILRLRYLTIDNKRKLATITQRKQKEDGKIEKGTTVIIVCECLSFSRNPAGFSLRGLRSVDIATAMDTSA
eukprot:TRINITY_DN1809_c0_g1_i1.p2 TRINITY_DN1809_c0_g1~~TRINITY_DN1809_c0_g1_i1.p2  ORF type:complete len:167 (-),score=30.82 TRINITY_DN1809_c0_g1_i1:90-590(-)